MLWLGVRVRVRVIPPTPPPTSAEMADSSRGVLGEGAAPHVGPPLVRVRVRARARY